MVELSCSMKSAVATTHGKKRLTLGLFIRADFPQDRPRESAGPAFPADLSQSVSYDRDQTDERSPEAQDTGRNGSTMLWRRAILPRKRLLDDRGLGCGRSSGTGSMVAMSRAPSAAVLVFACVIAAASARANDFDRRDRPRRANAHKIRCDLDGQRGSLYLARSPAGEIPLHQHDRCADRCACRLSLARDSAGERRGGWLLGGPGFGLEVHDERRRSAARAATR